jgi:cell division protein FtsL
MREQAKRLNWLTEAQAVLGWGLILILAALLGAIYLGQTSRIAGVGRRVQVLQNELESLKRENAALEREVAEAQSLERLRQEAVRLGFVQSQPADIEYVIVPNYPADRQQAANEAMATPTPVAAPAQHPPPETMGDALWLSLKTSIGDLMQGEASEQ